MISPRKYTRKQDGSSDRRLVTRDGSREEGPSSGSRLSEKFVESEIMEKKVEEPIKSAQSSILESKNNTGST